MDGLRLAQSNLKRVGGSDRLFSAEAIACAVLLVSGNAIAASECASCHRDQAHSQPSTDMAWALMPAGANKVLHDRSTLTFRHGAYSYEVKTQEGQSSYTVTDGKDKLSVPIRWAFGSRSQTWLLEYKGHFYESFVSYFAAIDKLDITVGDGSIDPKTLLEAFGRAVSDAEIKSCFSCHATRAVAGNQVKLDELVPGVQCERCHEGAERHAEAVAQGKTAPIPQKLGRRSPEEISNFCGQCHRTWEDVMQLQLHGKTNVRFQPYRLANSKCYDGHDRRMSCIACHDPHHNVTREAEAYDAKCLACHSAATRVTARETCKVGTSGCSNCHMPKVELPGGHMTFSDHEIRVVRAGEPYPD